MINDLHALCNLLLIRYLNERSFPVNKPNSGKREMITAHKKTIIIDLEGNESP